MTPFVKTTEKSQCILYCWSGTERIPIWEISGKFKTRGGIVGERKGMPEWPEAQS